MAQLDTKERDRLRDSQFAYIAPKGERHLPLSDESHVRNAMARFDQTDFDSADAKERARRKIVRAAKRHGIEVDPGDDVAKPVRSHR